MSKKWKIVLAVFVLILGFGGALLLLNNKIVQNKGNQNKDTKETPKTAPTPQTKKEVSLPIDNAKARITKKPFGIYITPQNSPVQPEKFTGFHTGTDFETTSDELNKEIPIFAVSDGKILEKKIVSGYGGVIVQSGIISDQKVTILYGHINISQSAFNVGDQLSQGQKLAILGDNQSYYTGEERKHLHLGIHKGEEIDYRGYVGNQSELSQWIDITLYL